MATVGTRRPWILDIGSTWVRSPVKTIWSIVLPQMRLLRASGVVVAHPQCDWWRTWPRRPYKFMPIRCQTGPSCPPGALGQLFSSSRRIVNRSPTSPISAISKIGASASLLIATMVPASLMPVRCWMAPEMPMAT